MFNYYVNLPYHYNDYYNRLIRDQVNQEYFRRSNTIQLGYYNPNPTPTTANLPTVNSLNNLTNVSNNIVPVNQAYTYPNINKVNQKLLIVRHGERVDSYYGANWIQNSFTANGLYFRSDLNMPKRLIQRDNPFDFEFDPPLTENGLKQARMLGEELAKAGIRLNHMYSSPALRSIQTADKILEGMGLKDVVPIRIEIGLFELLSWQLYIPNKYPFIDKQTLRSFGYNIDLNYRSLLVFDNIKTDETINDYYLRSNYITKIIVDSHSDEGDVMLVGHAPSLEGCSRLLTGENMRTLDEFAAITRQIPFLSVAQLEKNYPTGTWKLTPLAQTRSEQVFTPRVENLNQQIISNERTNYYTMVKA